MKLGRDSEVKQDLNVGILRTRHKVLVITEVENIHGNEKKVIKRWGK